MAAKPHPLQQSLARIFRNNQNSPQPCGVGVVVSQSQVLTCSHVVTAALNLPPNITETPDQVISIDFPFSNLKEPFTAKIVFWDIQSDLAVLECLNKLPDNAMPAVFNIVQNLWEHNIQAFGFPSGYADGTWAKGQLRGSNVSGWIEIVDSQTTGYYVQQGFSGGPVWDDDLENCIGIVVAAEKNALLRTSYLIPANIIVEKWKGLPIGKKQRKSTPSWLKKFSQKRKPYILDLQASPRVVCPRCGSMRNPNMRLPCELCGSKQIPWLGYVYGVEAGAIGAVIISMITFVAIIGCIFFIVWLYPK